MEDTHYQFSAPLWLYSGAKASWHFVTVPKETSAGIRFFAAIPKTTRGWGAVPVEVRIGKSIWRTSVFPNRKEGTYLLPIKASIRKAEQLVLEQIIDVTLQLSK